MAASPRGYHRLGPASPTAAGEAVDTALVLGLGDGARIRFFRSCHLLHQIFGISVTVAGLAASFSNSFAMDNFLSAIHTIIFTVGFPFAMVVYRQWLHWQDDQAFAQQRGAFVFSAIYWLGTASTIPYYFYIFGPHAEEAAGAFAEDCLRVHDQPSRMMLTAVVEGALGVLMFSWGIDGRHKLLIVLSCIPEILSPLNSCKAYWGTQEALQTMYTVIILLCSLGGMHAYEVAMRG